MVIDYSELFLLNEFSIYLIKSPVVVKIIFHVFLSFLSFYDFFVHILFRMSFAYQGKRAAKFVEYV